MRSICGSFIAEENTDVWVNDYASEGVGNRCDGGFEMVTGHHYELAPGWSIQGASHRPVCVNRQIGESENSFREEVRGPLGPLAKRLTDFLFLAPGGAVWKDYTCGCRHDVCRLAFLE